MNTIGVLGGGQLGRMLGSAGISLNCRCVFLDSAPDSSAAAVGRVICAPFDDFNALDTFCDGLTVATYEFENVPLASAQRVAEKVTLYPPPEALVVSQDRLREKTFFRSLGIETAPFDKLPAGTREEQRVVLKKVLRVLGFPAVLKTARLGYDGRGQAFIRAEEDLDRALDAVKGQEAIVEGFIRFRRELSIISVRDQHGTVVFYPLVENVHKGGILRFSRCAQVEQDSTLQSMAESYARSIMEKLQYVGTMALELFEVDGALMANEMAPRVHNSGHWTIEGSETSQFENHLRAILGLPLGSTESRGSSAMINLIGFLPPAESVLACPGVHLHGYGKEVRKGRKVGHLTVTAPNLDELNRRITSIETVLRQLGYDYLN